MESHEKPINIFDFDGTLTTETWPKFWVWVNKFGYNGSQRNDDLENALATYRSTHSGDHLETFFGFFNDLLIDNNETITYEELMEGENYITYNPGVKIFLEKAIANNYIVSGGLKEFLQHLKIAKYFQGIYGTPVKHNNNGLISGIGDVMTNDKKIKAIQDILIKNHRQENDCRNVYYIGDGYSDAFAMKFIHDNGGKAIFVHQPHQNDDLQYYNDQVYETLNKNGIIDYCCIANYNDNSVLSNILQRKK